MQEILGLYNYWIVIFLMMTGFYIVIARTNLIQKVIGLNIFQISVFLLYITMGKVTGGTAPILQEQHGHDSATHVAAVHHDDGGSVVVSGHQVDQHGEAKVAHVAANSAAETAHAESHAADQEPSTQEQAGQEHSAGHQAEPVVYTHPLPSVLMLTAIVVGVATTAVALALIIRIGEAYGTIEEDEILQLDRETT